MSTPNSATADDALDRPPTQDERLLAQVGQALIATRAQAAAVIEQCNSALMTIAALQEREELRANAIAAVKSVPTKPAPPATFGATKKEGDHGKS